MMDSIESPEPTWAQEAYGVSQARTGLLVVDERGIIVRATEGAAHLLGTPQTALVGSHWRHTFTGYERDEVPERLLRTCLRDGAGHWAGRRGTSAHRLRSTYERDDSVIIEHLSGLPPINLFDEAIIALDHAERLQELSAALSKAQTLSEAVDAVVVHALPAFGGRSAAALWASDDRTHLTFIEGRLSPVRIPEEHRRIPLDAESDIVDAWNHGRAEWIANEQAYERVFGPNRPGLEPLGITSLAIIPMRIGLELVGMLMFDMNVDPAQQALKERFAEVVAQACAHAFERARLADREREMLRAVKESEKRLRLALQTGRMVTWEYDRASDLLTTLENAEETGIDQGPPRVIDIFANDVHPDDRAETRRLFNEALRTGNDLEVAFRRRFADGSWRWLAARALCIRDAEGHVKGLIGVSRDVNEEKRAELKLRASEELFRTVAEALPVMVWTTSHGGDTDYFNKHYWDYSGLERGSNQENSSHSRKLLHPDDAERVVAAWREGIERQQPWLCEYRMRRKDGAYRWHLGGMVPVCAQNGEVIRWVGSATDIDDQKRVLAEREDLLRRTQDAVQGREVFLAVAAHELRTPLTPLRLQIDTLLRALRSPSAFQTERVQRGLEVASRQIHRLQLLVEALLDVSRIASGRIELAEDEVDLVMLANEIVERHRPEGAPGQLRLQTPESLRVRTDRMRVEQVLTNLVTNALKYGRGRTVRVKLTREGDDVHLVVQDEGLGISAEDSERIFERFERASGNLPHGGLGLGLWIVRQIITTMGGSIEVASELGRGSTFTVVWPGAAATAQPKGE